MESRLLQSRLLRRKETAMARKQPHRPSENPGVQLGFGDLFKGLGSFLDMVSQMDAEGKRETSQTGEFTAGRTKAMYGFTVKLGLGGTPVVERFGNVRETDDGPQVADVREPLVDVLDEDDHLRVIAELPGVDEAGIRLEVQGDVLTIHAESGDRQYAREVLLPCAVQAAGISKSYTNGVLDVKLPKQGEGA